MKAYKGIYLLLIVGYAGGWTKGKAQDIDLVVRAGLNLATVTGIDAGAQNMPRLGIHVGGDLGISLDPALSLNAGVLLYSDKGTVNRQTIFQAGYLEMPLYLRWQKDDWPVQFVGGLQPAFLMRAYVNDGRGDITPLIRRTDLSVLLGIAYPFKDHWLFGLRIGQGLLKVGESGQEHTYHTVAYLTAGYRL